MSDMINPYIAGAPVTETRMFFGREDVFDWIQNSLSGRYADHILVIHGQRRVGKTSVLKQLGNRLPEKYIPVFFDLQGRTHTTLDRFLWWLAREIVRVLKQERDITVSAPERDVFAADLEYFETRFLPNLRPYIGDHTLLLTFDEFDNLEESEIKEELARPLIDYLRRLMGEDGLSFIFSIGSSGRKLENMQAAYTEFFKTALYKKISFLSEEQTRGLITRPVEGLLEYDRAGVRHIFELASGHPYFTQLTCHELFARCQLTGQRHLKDEDVNAVLEDVVERGTVNLKFTWDEASDIEKWGLAALAQLDKADNRTLTDFLRKQRVRFSDSDLTSGLLHLREKDILTPDNRFVIYLLKLWLQKNRPIEQVREELTEVNPIANRYIEIGLEFKDSGLFDKAIESFQEALTIAPENIQAQVNIALVYVEQKAFDKAVVEFEKALNIDDEDVVARAGLCDAHLALGDAALAKGRAKDAVQSYQRVLDINKEHLEARQRMAEISRQRAEKALDDGKDEEALSLFAEALKFTPEDQGLIQRVEEVRAEKKAKVLTELAARSEKEARARNWEKAIAALKEALEFAPEDHSILEKIETIKTRQLQERLDAILLKADQAEKVSRWDTAIAALNEYLALKPGEAFIQKRLSDLIQARHAAWLNAILARSAVAVSTEKWDEAVSALNEVLALEPENAEIRAKLTEVREAQRKARLAAILRRADLAVQAGKWDEAISALNEGLASEPENELIQRKLAEVREARRAARLEAAIRLADASAQAGKWDIAIQSLNEILAIEPENDLIRKKLAEAQARQRESQLKALRAQARALAKAEKFDEALSVWGQYLALGPEDVEKAQSEIESVQQAQRLTKSYAEAQKAYAKKNYEKTISLLKDVIDRDVNYKDASLLLAQAIELRRAARKWWQSKLLWGGVGGVALLVVAWFGLRPGSPLMNALSASSTIAPTGITTMSSPPDVTATSTATSTPAPTPTAIPLSWARLNSGQFLERDTITAIAVDPSDPGVMYAGTENAGIYKSIDGGLSWQPAHNGIGPTAIDTLVIDPQNPQTLFAGILLGGLYKTTDGGRNWLSVSGNFDLNVKEIASIAVMDAQDNQHLLYSPAFSLYESTDGGQSWNQTPKALCPEVIGALAMDPTDSETLFAMDVGGECTNGLYASNDGGETWSLAIEGKEPGEAHLAIDSTGEKIYAGTSDWLYTSSDGGATWSETGQGGCNALAVLPEDGNVAYCASGSRLLQTTDGGENWRFLGDPLFAWNKTLIVSPHNPSILLAGGNGLAVSTDGGASWEDRSNGLGASKFEAKLALDENLTMYTEQNDCTFYRSPDLGLKWEMLSDRYAGCDLEFDAGGQTRYLTVRDDPSQNYSILRSTDQGGTWESLPSPGPGRATAVAHPHRQGVLFLVFDDPSENVRISPDYGSTWQQVEAAKSLWSARFFSSQSNDDILYAISESFLDPARSDDGGESWNSCLAGGGNIDLYVTRTDTRAVIDPGDSNHLLVATQGDGVLVSLDGCQSWQTSNNGLGSLFVNTLVIDPNNPDTIYAGTGGGAYISSDSGQTWGQVNDGLLGATVVYSIVVDKDSNVYAATPYGIFKLESK